MPLCATASKLLPDARAAFPEEGWLASWPQAELRLPFDPETPFAVVDFDAVAQVLHAQLAHQGYRPAYYLDHRYTWVGGRYHGVELIELITLVRFTEIRHVLITRRARYDFLKQRLARWRDDLTLHILEDLVKVGAP